MPFLIPIAIAAVAATASTAISGGFSSNKPSAPEIPYDQTPEGIRKKQQAISGENIKRQQAKFGQEDTILSSALNSSSQSFRGNTLLGGAS